MGAVGTLVKHAFGARTVAPVAISVVAAYTTLWQLNMSIDDPDFWMLGAVSLILCAISWVAIARESYQKEKEAKRLDAMIIDLRDRIPIVPLETGQPLENLTSLSNAGLRNRAAAVTNSLREFHRLCAEQGETMPRYDRSLSEVERRRQWQADVDEMTKRSRERQADFNLQYRPMAVAVVEEIRRRLGVKPEPSHVSYEGIALETGMLAGVSPLLDSAHLIERLARKLPN